MKQKLITVEANCDKGKKNSENEQFTEGGRSRTQARTYFFKIISLFASGTTPTLYQMGRKWSH